MEALPWFWIWVVLAAGLCIGEMLTASFFMLPFAVGAGVAAIACVLGSPLWLQFLLFLVVSIVALAALRPVAKRVTRSNVEKAGADRLLGRAGTVIAGEPHAGGFRVLVDRDEWNANTEDGTVLGVGTQVQVLAIDGTRLIVRAVVSQ